MRFELTNGSIASFDGSIDELNEVLDLLNTKGGELVTPITTEKSPVKLVGMDESIPPSQVAAIISELRPRCTMSLDDRSRARVCYFNKADLNTLLIPDVIYKLVDGVVCGVIHKIGRIYARAGIWTVLYSTMWEGHEIGRSATIPISRIRESEIRTPVEMFAAIKTELKSRKILTSKADWYLTHIKVHSLKSARDSNRIRNKEISEVGLKDNSDTAE